VTRYTLAIRADHLHVLKSAIRPANGHERVAYLLMGTATIGRDPWSGHPVRKFLSYEVIPGAAEDVVSSSDVHVKCRTRTFARVIKRANDEGLAVGVVHSHPNSLEVFSPQDDSDEPHLVQLAQNRNGEEAEVLSVVLTGNDQLFGRVWTSPSRFTPLDLILVVGDRLEMHYRGRAEGQTPDQLHRQALAFGQALQADLAKLRVGIVGCGATGSAVAMLLARMGVQKFFVIDRDHAEITNLSRLHGASIRDAAARIPKVDILKRHLEEMGLGASVRTANQWVGHPDCRDGLRSCDVVFGCTDDHDGRLFLNRFAYFYDIPVFDMGIKIHVSDEDPPRIEDASGRVTILLPGTRCLLCRNIVNPRRAAEEQLKREDPGEYEWRRQRGQQYVEGNDEPQPAIVTLTTDVACMAVDELVQRLTGYRNTESISNRVRKYHLSADKRPGPANRELCSICLATTYWGRGDMTPFLDRVG
jgi:molybdopterin/thiamine biosynthesis adenylyltransferase